MTSPIRSNPSATPNAGATGLPTEQTPKNPDDTYIRGMPRKPKKRAKMPRAPRKRLRDPAMMKTAELCSSIERYDFESPGGPLKTPLNGSSCVADSANRRAARDDAMGRSASDYALGHMTANSIRTK